MIHFLTFLHLWHKFNCYSIIIMLCLYFVFYLNLFLVFWNFTHMVLELTFVNFYFSLLINRFYLLILHYLLGLLFICPVSPMSVKSSLDKHPFNCLWIYKICWPSIPPIDNQWITNTNKIFAFVNKRPLEIQKWIYKGS